MVKQICLVLLAVFALASSQDNEQLGYSKLNGQLLTYVSSKGSELWGLDRNNNIYHHQEATWTPVPFTAGSAVQIGAAEDGSAWVVTSTGTVFRYNTATKAWDPIQGISLIQINALSKDAALGVGKDHNLFIFNPTTSRFLDIKTAIDGKIAWAALGNNGEQWLVDLGGFVYHYNPTKKVFERVAGSNIVRISCQSKSRVLALSNQGNVYHWEKATSTWHQLPGSAKSASISEDNVFLVNEVENVYSLELSSVDKAKLDSDSKGPAPLVAAPPTLAPLVIASKEDDSFADTNAYVFCANAPLDPSSFLISKYKPAWQWLKTGDNYVMVKGHWNQQSCSFGGATTLRVTKEVYDDVLAKCKKAGFDTVQPANSIVSEYKAFQVQGDMQPYWREIEHWTWLTPLAFPTYERMKGGKISTGCVP